MKIYNYIVKTALVALFTVLSQSVHAADIDTPINASETRVDYLDAFIEANKPDSFDCIDLKISGICAYIVVRVYICPPPSFVCVEVLPEFSVQLTHNNPDLLVASYRKLGDSPLDATRLLYDEIQLLLAKPILEIISGEPVPEDFKRDKAWAANTSEASNNKYKSTLQYTEVDIIGHPGNILSHWWDTVEKGALPVDGVPEAILGSIEEGATRIPLQVSDAAQHIALDNGTTEDAVTEIGHSDWDDHPLATSLVGQADNTFVSTVAGIASLFQEAQVGGEELQEGIEILNNGVFNALDGVAETWDSINEGIELLDRIPDATEQITEAGGGYGIVTDPIFSFCPSDAKMLKPYFLSGANIIQWRYNIPEIVYPESYQSSFIENHKKNFIANGTHSPNNNFWGPLFPRNGYVLQPDPMKASAVTAVRGVHVATREFFGPDTNQIHVYSPIRKRTNHGKGIKMVSQPDPYDLENIKTGQWQLMGPRSDSNCIRFGEGDLVQTGSIELPGGVEVTRDDLPWTHGKHSDDNNYVWTLWREYTCCPTPTRASRDIFFEYFDLPTVPLTIDLL